MMHAKPDLRLLFQRIVQLELPKLPRRNRLNIHPQAPLSLSRVQFESGKSFIVRMLFVVPSKTLLMSSAFILVPFLKSAPEKKGVVRSSSVSWNPQTTWQVGQKRKVRGPTRNQHVKAVSMLKRWLGVLSVRRAVHAWEQRQLWNAD